MAINGPFTSEVSICNQALSWLGIEPIISFNDQSTTAEWCRNNYPFVRDAVLEERMWTFATDRTTSEVADLDDWGQMYKHPVPAGWLSVFRVYRNVRSATRPLSSEGWSREGEYILSREATVYMWGVKQVTDTGKFSPLFVQALAARLAADAAIPLTENQQLQGSMWQLYGAKLADAATRDGQQGDIERLQSNTLIDVRGGM